MSSVELQCVALPAARSHQLPL